eukprot:scaffold23147_cov147-Isochrysis_galbana.AAC.3
MIGEKEEAERVAPSFFNAVAPITWIGVVVAYLLDADRAQLPRRLSQWVLRNALEAFLDVAPAPDSHAKCAEEVRMTSRPDAALVVCEHLFIERQQLVEIALHKDHLRAEPQRLVSGQQPEGSHPPIGFAKGKVPRQPFDHQAEARSLDMLRGGAAQLFGVVALYQPRPQSVHSVCTLRELAQVAEELLKERKSDLSSPLSPQVKSSYKVENCCPTKFSSSEATSRFHSMRVASRLPETSCLTWSKDLGKACLESILV